MEKDADCRRPKNDVEEGQHHPEKKGRNPDKQGQKGAVFRFPIGCQHNLTRVGVNGAGGKAVRTEGKPMYFSLLLARGQSVKRQCALQGPRRKSRSETRKALYSLWLFHLHSMVKIQPFSPVFPLAGSTAKAFFRLSLWNFKEKASTIFYNTAMRKGCVPGIAILVM